MADAFQKVAGITKDLIKQGINYNATIEQLQTSFAVMTGDAEKATELIERLRKVGAETPYELQGLASTVQLLMQYGMTADEAYESTLQLGDIAQGSSEKMNGIALALGQMSSYGKVTLQDIKQMIGNGFNPLQEISRTTGESMTSLYDRISKGTLTVEEVTNAFKTASSEGGAYFQSMEKQSKTFNGQLSTLKDNMNELLGKAMQPITNLLSNKIFPIINDILNGGKKLNKWIQDNKTAIQLLTTGIITLTSAIAAYTIAKNIDIIIIWAYVTATDAAAVATGLLSSAMAFLTSPITLIILAIGALVAAFIYLWNNSEAFRNFWINLWENIKNVFTKTWEGIKKFFTETIPSWINGFIDFFANFPERMGEILGFVLGKILEWNIEVWNWVTIELPKIIDKIVEWFKQLPGRIWDWLVQIITNFVQWAIDMKTKADEKVKEIIDKIVEFFKELPEKIKEIGKEIVTGLWEGIKSKSQWLKEQVSSFGNGIKDGFKRAFKIQSPSKVMRDEIGRYLPQGIAEGIEDDTDVALRAIDNMNNEIMDRMNRAVNIETGNINANATIKGNNMLNVMNANLSIESNVIMDGQKVGEITTPYVTQTLREAGAY